MKDTNRLQQFRSVCCKSILFAAVLALFSLFISVSYSNAQSTGGRIRGTVTDASGGAVAGVKVSLVNTATNISRESVTGTTGEYLFLEVPVGAYEININQPGFKKYVPNNILMNLNPVLWTDL